jgi:orotate phosphoribosyltransferase
LDKDVAPNIVELFIRYINHYINPSTDGPFLIVGMEVAGGMLVSQLASANNKDLNERADFVYMRKKKKSTGTRQQLEGPQRFTSRNANSPLLKAVWIDDSLSTGASMLEGMQLLKEHYNIQVVAALYLVDRSEDRKNIPDSQQKLADKTIDDVDIYAIYDLQDIDQLINKRKE